MPDRSRYLSVAKSVLDYARKNDFAGYSKFDALNSPFLNRLTFGNRFLRLLYIQFITRFPLNLRPLFRVKISRNPKGIALFARGCLVLYELTKEEKFAETARSLLDWLLNNHSNDRGTYSGLCYGYNFYWQSLFFDAPPYFPNQTVSTFCGEAFIKGYRVLGEERYLAAARSIAQFLLNDLPVLEEDESVKCIGYVPGPCREKVININSMAAAFLAKLFKETGDELYRTNAVKLVNFVEKHRTPDHFWTYITAKEKSYVDNYHTGGIIEQIYEVMIELEEFRWLETLKLSLQNYRSTLFCSNGLARYRDDRTWPVDIHSCAQGVLTFSKLHELLSSSLDFAGRILDYTLDHLYNEEGYFYYQKTRFFTKRFTFMRWCNSWMFYAIAEYLFQRRQSDTKKGGIPSPLATRKDG